MNEKEFNLSHKIEECGDALYPNSVLDVKDVREFIRLLRHKFSDEPKNNYIARDIWFEINKLVGEKLI